MNLIYAYWIIILITFLIITLYLDKKLERFARINYYLNKLAYFIILILLIKTTYLEFVKKTLERSSLVNPYAILATILLFTLLEVLNLAVLDKKIAYDVSKEVREEAIREALKV